MLDAIAGLSALAAGMVTPVSLRRVYSPKQDQPEPGLEPTDGDRLELSAGQIHEEGQICPLCGVEIADRDGWPSPVWAAGKHVPPKEKLGLSAGLASSLTPENQEKLKKLRERDQEVRAHEQAHKAAGGQYAGSTSYSYQTGPDGRQYAVGGEVSMDLSPVPGDPQATIAKMQQIQRAALAPAQPSSQDRQVAAQAGRIEAKARAELAEKKTDQAFS
ncbi:MAG: putative metalloprotease CJM1_0395 family protein, partial [Phycisphaerae bacterium]